MIDRKMSASLFAAILAVSVAAADAATTLPEPLIEAVNNNQAKVVFRVRWQALWNHPVVLAAMNNDADDSLMVRNPAGMLVHRIASGLAVTGLGPSVVEEAWLVEGSGSRGPWLRSGLAGEQLDTALHKAGWQLESAADEPAVWVHDHAPETVKWQQQALEDTDDEEQRAELEEAFDSSRPRLSRCGEHWLVASPYGRLDTTPGAECREAELDTDDLPDFPYDVLFDESQATLAMATIDIPENDPPKDESATEESAEPSERERLMARLRELQNSDDGIVSQLADFSLTLSEVDGALILDVTARRPDGGGVAETARFLRMLLLGARFTIAPSAPALDRELANTVIEEIGNTVQASCTVSQATLIEIIEGEAERRREIQELKRQLDDIDQER